MKIAALAIAEYAREVENAPRAGRQQLLAGELRRGVQIEWFARAVGRGECRREGMQMRFIARRGLQDRAFHFDETGVLEPRPHCFFDALPGPEARAAVGMSLGIPPAL